MNITTDQATREMIKSMAAEIQTTAAKAFHIYTTGLQVDAALDLAALIGGMIAAYIAGKKTFSFAEEYEPGYNYDTLEGLMWASLAAVLTLLVAGYLFAIIGDLIHTIIMPEYTAMQNVIHAVSQ